MFSVNRDIKIEPNQGFYCKLCKLMCQEESEFHNHVCSSHVKPLVENNVILRSKSCVKTFRSKNSLREHEKTLHVKIKDCQCTICYKNFGNRHHLKQHVDSVHLKKKPFQCQICKIKYGRKFQLEDHNRNRHTNIREKCPICAKEVALLKQHIRLAHRKKNKCDLCSSKFTSLWRLQVHVNSVHEKIQPIQRTQSPEKFTRKVELDIHVKRFQNNILLCYCCDDWFGSTSDLMSHVKTVHQSL
jgi:KRAB domain-containing zinc finger protein